MATLYRVYPGRDWLKEPLWLAQAVRRSIPALLAMEEMRLSRAVRAAVLGKKGEYTGYIRRLEREMAVHIEREVVNAVRPASETARAWFIENDIPMIEA